MAHGRFSPSGLAANDQSLAPRPILALAPAPGAFRTGTGIVRRPRLFLIYRVEHDRVIVGRVLHDAMELACSQDAAASWEQEPASELSEEAYRRPIGRKPSAASGMSSLQWLLSQRPPAHADRRSRGSARLQVEASEFDAGHDSYCAPTGGQVSISMPKTGSERQVYSQLEPSSILIDRLIRADHCQCRRGRPELRVRRLAAKGGSQALRGGFHGSRRSVSLLTTL